MPTRMSRRSAHQPSTTSSWDGGRTGASIPQGIGERSPHIDLVNALVGDRGGSGLAQRLLARRDEFGTGLRRLPELQCEYQLGDGLGGQ